MVNRCTLCVKKQEDNLIEKDVVQHAHSDDSGETSALPFSFDTKASVCTHCRSIVEDLVEKELIPQFRDWMVQNVEGGEQETDCIIDVWEKRSKTGNWAGKGREKQRLWLVCKNRMLEKLKSNALGTDELQHLIAMVEQCFQGGKNIPRTDEVEPYSLFSSTFCVSTAPSTYKSHVSIQTKGNSSPLPSDVIQPNSSFSSFSMPSLTVVLSPLPSPVPEDCSKPCNLSSTTSASSLSPSNPPPFTVYSSTTTTTSASSVLCFSSSSSCGASLQSFSSDPTPSTERNPSSIHANAAATAAATVTTTTSSTGSNSTKSCNVGRKKPREDEEGEKNAMGETRRHHLEKEMEDPTSTVPLSPPPPPLLPLLVVAPSSSSLGVLPVSGAEKMEKKEKNLSIALSHKSASLDSTEIEVGQQDVKHEKEVGTGLPKNGPSTSSSCTSASTTEASAPLPVEPQKQQQQQNKIFWERTEHPEFSVLGEAEMYALSSHKEIRSALRSTALQSIIRSIDSSSCKLDALRLALRNDPCFKNFYDRTLAVILQAQEEKARKRYYF